MPYSITLTHSERRAIDWIGDRYWHGYQLWSLLTDGEATSIPSKPATTEQCDFDFEIESTWDYPGDVAYELTANQAYALKMSYLEQLDSADRYYWECFSAELASKLHDFMDSLV